MASETLFAICCIAQCATNYGARAYVGGVGACDFQGIYAAYYSFGSPALCALLVAYAARVLAPSATEPPEPPWRAAVGAAVVIHALALLIGMLLLLGAGKYLFAVDYCQQNVEGPLFAGLFLGWFALCLLCVVAACARLCAATAEMGGDKRAARLLLAVVRARRCPRTPRARRSCTDR